MKIYITGSKGQLGSDCVKVLSRTHTVIESTCDITSFLSLNREIETVNPDIILNCAAYTNVDKAESNFDKAFAVNSLAVMDLAAFSELKNIHLIHISTDYIFDGVREIPNGYSEYDIANPINVYGKTKYSGEEFLLGLMISGNYLIIRTSWLYGINGNNFLKTILKSSSQNKEINIVSDQYGCPTWSYNLAEQIEYLIHMRTKGIFHAVSGGYTSWYMFAKRFFKLLGVDIKLNPVTTDEYLSTPAKRPKNSILITNHYSLNIIMRNWEDSLEEFTLTYKKQLINN